MTEPAAQIEFDTLQDLTERLRNQQEEIAKFRAECNHLANLNVENCKKWNDEVRALRAEIAALKQGEPLKPIERDEDMDRTYIPLPLGWEVQTKGKGSTFRLCKVNSDGTYERWPLVEGLGYDALERMAKELHEYYSIAPSHAIAFWLKKAADACNEIGHSENNLVRADAFYQARDEILSLITPDNLKELAEMERDAKQGSRVCTWEYDSDDFYRGACGIAWCFSADTPEENDCHYCPKCGGKIAMKGEK